MKSGSWLALAALMGACGPSLASRDFLDDRGSLVSVLAVAPKIVTLAPHLAEIAFAAGAGERLVGVSSASKFPEQARHLPVVARSGRIDFERVLRAQPDLVLGWMSGNPRWQLERLERAGIPVFATEVRGFDDIPRLTRLLGRLAGTEAVAEPAAQALEREIAVLPAIQTSRYPRVFVEIWHLPLMTVSGKHLISEAVRVCGGRNVFEDAPFLTGVISPERLLKAAPELVIVNASPGDESALSRWNDGVIPAVRLRQIHAIDPDVLHGFGPRLLQAAREMCAHISQARRALAGFR